MGDSTMSHEVQDKFLSIEARLDALEAAQPPPGNGATTQGTDDDTTDDEEEEV